MKKIVFMGTPDFAVASLKALVDAGIEIAGVVTAPDRASGRGQKVQAPPVKTFAVEHGITSILQPEKLKSEEFLNELKNLNADLFVVVAFRMLPEMVWSMPSLGTINLHASLLPHYRGAAPINWALINGERETGVTTFFIEKEIDTGKILFSEKVKIDDNTTAGELHDVLMETGAQLLVKTVRSIFQGDYVPKSQSNFDNRILHAAPKIFKENCRIQWNQPGKAVHNFIRGLSPYPAAWTEFKIREEIIQFKIFSVQFEAENHNLQSGKLFTDRKTFVKVAVKDGYMKILSLQMAGKKQVTVGEFLRGLQPTDLFESIVDV